MVDYNTLNILILHCHFFFSVGGTLCIQLIYTIWNALRDWSEMEYLKENEKAGDRLLKDFVVGL